MVKSCLTKKSQAWGIDLIIGMMIFITGIIVFYIYSLNSPTEAQESIENLKYDGEIILSSLFSEGYPEDWDSENVVTPGILTDNKIDELKVERFSNLAISDYDKSKSLFNTRYDFFLEFQEPISSIDGIGKPGVTADNIDSIQCKNLIKLTKISIHQNKPINSYLYIWE